MTFHPVVKVFKMQVKIRAKLDMTGPVPGTKHHERKRWALRTGREVWVDADVAREWEAKGYVDVLLGREKIDAVSDDELAELTSKDAKIGL